MRWLRLLIALYIAKFRSRLRLNDSSVVSFRVWLTDIDASVMNHASMMTVFEAGRIDYMVRSGFFELARKKRWFFPNAGISVQFFRPLKLFQKARVTTRVFHVSGLFFYIEQKMIREDKVVAICITKSKVKRQRTDVDPEKIIQLLNAGEKPVEAADLVEIYDHCNALFKERLGG